MVLAGLTKGLGKGKYKIYGGSTTGPSSYTSGGFNVTISGLSKIHAAVVVSNGNRVAVVKSISGNTITIAVYEEAGAAGPLAEVAAGTDLSGYTFWILAIGE